MQLEALQPGDIVDLVAPASACSRSDLDQGICAIRELGLIPRVPKNIFAKSVLFSNSDERRLEQLRVALYARDSKLIWCIRGGYGVLRLMPEILRWRPPQHRKLVLGYSDITTLHQHLNQQWNWPSLHGPLVDRLGRGAIKGSERRYLLGLLFGRVDQICFHNLKPLNAQAKASRVIRGKVLGGNMAVLQSGLGTPSAMDPRGTILFFEDIGERPHRMDRMLTQFEQVGWFRNARAVVLGDFILGESKDRRNLWKDVIPRFAEAQKIPVLCGLPVGHSSRRQWPLPLNTWAELALGVRGQLTVKSPVRLK